MTVDIYPAPPFAADAQLFASLGTLDNRIPIRSIDDRAAPKGRLR
jgi:hypothetical protein